MDPKMSVGLETPTVNISLSSTWMPSLTTPTLKLPTPILEGLNSDWGSLAQPSATNGVPTSSAGGLLSAGAGILGSGVSPRLMLESLRMSPGVSGSIAPNMETPRPGSSASVADLFMSKEYQDPPAASAAFASVSAPFSSKAPPVPSLPTRAPPKPAHSSELSVSNPASTLASLSRAQPLARKQPTHQPKQSDDLAKRGQSQPAPGHTHPSLQQQHLAYQHEQQRLQAHGLPVPPMHRSQPPATGMNPLVYGQGPSAPYASLGAPAQRLSVGSSHAQLRGAAQPHGGMRPMGDARALQGALPPAGVGRRAQPQGGLHRAGMAGGMAGGIGMPGVPVLAGEAGGPSSSAIEEAKLLAQEKADKFAQKRKRSRRQTEEEKPKLIVDTEEDKKLSPADLKKKRYNRRLELNRQSAAVSRVRRRAYVEELEGKLMNVEKEKLSLEDQVTVMHAENIKLREQMRQLQEHLSGARAPSAYQGKQ